MPFFSSSKNLEVGGKTRRKKKTLPPYTKLINQFRARTIKDSTKIFGPKSEKEFAKI